ncbi:hypothetical protein B0920_24545 [Massilia sp. KIM]|uniref:hypothetical protein n=1 Tax=Massilia sp. KIM TaxID=1955422 RepID=UPI0009CD8541|nr:hypothetical protein [Massilia sp. KIM]OON59542.1 hypothetical protein B0920_24545 [Massilia sp. KIM]
MDSTMTRPFRRLPQALATATAAVILAGCASSTPTLDREFGRAVRANLAAQVADPAAAANPNLDPAAGIDGRAARAAHDRYQRSFARPEPAASAPLVSSGLSK